MATAVFLILSSGVAGFLLTLTWRRHKREQALVYVDRSSLRSRGGWLKGAAYGLLVWLAALLGVSVVGHLLPQASGAAVRLAAILLPGGLAAPFVGGAMLVAWRNTAMPHLERGFF